MIGIYKITSPTKKIYIGQSIDVNDRFTKYKRLNCDNQTILIRSFRKYGVDSHKFEILEECLESELNDKERYYQDVFECVGKNGLNCKLTKSSDRNGILSAETRIRIGLGNRGKVVSSEARKKISIANKNPSKETRLRMSLSQKGRVCSELTKTKMSLANKGMSKEFKKKIILDVNTGVFYFGLIEASNIYGITRKTLQRQLSGFSKNKTNLTYI